MASASNVAPKTPKKDKESSREKLESTPNSRGTGAFAATDNQPHLKYATLIVDHKLLTLLLGRKGRKKLHRFYKRT
jgi:hypothetical protein